jgi:hypothetical protein
LNDLNYWAQEIHRRPEAPFVGQSSPVKVFLSYGHDQNAPLVAGAALLSSS